MSYIYIYFYGESDLFIHSWETFSIDELGLTNDGLTLSLCQIHPDLKVLQCHQFSTSWVIDQITV